MKKQNTINIGIVGVGHLGNFHLAHLTRIPNISISGLFDNNTIRAEEMSKKYKIKSYLYINELLQKSDAIIIATPTSTHYNIAYDALNEGCHLFIEKPITNNVLQAEKLLIEAKRAKKIIQVGHIERFNPAFNYIKKMNLNPKFIESHRFAEFNNRGNDVRVVLDLMIHEIDIILSLIKSKILAVLETGLILSKEE